ncbi:MAG: DUF3445 domain-containing protein [Actinomycetota bacterium]
MEGTAPWLDELDLRVEARPVEMGTRALGDRPWLVVDDHRDAELALKRALRAEHGAEVFAALDGSEEASAEVLALVLDAVGGDPEPDLHPLDDAGLRVQEDLCVVQPVDGSWQLRAASLHFPSRWRLADKLGRSITEVHGPVDRYRAALAARVDRLFERIGERPVLRRNWFVHPDPRLFQPDRPVGGDPVVAADRALDELHVRSERQTLRRLPGSGAVLFTIRVQQVTLAELVADAARRAALVRLLDEGDADVLSHRGLAAPQVAELRRALGAAA